MRILTTPRGLADVSVSENHVKRYYCIKALENASKSSFLYYYNGTKKHEGFLGFENACSRAKTYIILTSFSCISFLCMLLLMMSIFVTA